MTNIVKAGETYRFDTKGTDSKWKAWDGCTCTVIRALTEEEVDIADVGSMWRIRFEDDKHTETDAFDDELYGPLQEKIVLITGSLVNTFITDLPYGEPTDAGDRRSRYFNIATVMGRGSFVKAALIEEKAGLPSVGYGYCLHVLNDVDGLDGYFLDTDRLDEEELSKLLDELAYDMAHCRA